MGQHVGSRMVSSLDTEVSTRLETEKKCRASTFYSLPVWCVSRQRSVLTISPPWPFFAYACMNNEQNRLLFNTTTKKKGPSVFSGFVHTSGHNVQGAICLHRELTPHQAKVKLPMKFFYADGPFLKTRPYSDMVVAMLSPSCSNLPKTWTGVRQS